MFKKWKIKMYIFILLFVLIFRWNRFCTPFLNTYILEKGGQKIFSYKVLNHAFNWTEIL